MVKMDERSIVDAIMAFVLFIILAMIFFIIVAFVVRVGVELVTPGDWKIGVDFLAVSAAILTGCALIAGGKLADVFKRP